MAIKNTVLQNSRFIYNILCNESIVDNADSNPVFGFILRDNAGNLNFQWKLIFERAGCLTKMKIALVSSNCLSSTWKVNAQLYVDGQSSIVSHGSVTEIFCPGRAVQLPIHFPSDFGLTCSSLSFVNYILKSTFAVQEYTQTCGDLCDAIQSMFKHQEYCDITLKAQNKEIKAHKMIVAARSPVFAAMFENVRAENQSNTVVINDISFEVLQEMLSYIYSGKVKNIKDYDLLIAADKYDLQGLKAECEMQCCIDLSRQNCVESFILADKLSFNNLKSQSLELILNHIADITSRAEWKRLKLDYPELAASIFRQYVLKIGR